MGSMSEETLRLAGPLIVGGGPVGMLTSIRLAQHGVPCTLFEMNMETTRWPKMDNNNPRTMEILRVMGLADEYRAQLGAVPQSRDWDTIFFNTCGPDGKLVTKWHMPCNTTYQAKIHLQNDGSHPAEPGQRCSQIVLEAWLKKKCLAEKLITCRFGYKYISHDEDDKGVTASFLDPDKAIKMFRAEYMVGADGGQSQVRKNANIKLEGRILPAAFFMVHFRSKALRDLAPFGRWWHAFNLYGGFIIDQDDNGTYTCHEPCSIDDTEAIRGLEAQPEQVPYRLLGGLGQPYTFEIDEILVANAWRPNFALAESYASRGGLGRVLIAGDAAHRNPPHGGYGMNTGVEDAISLAWRLAALHNGYGGEKLVPSYTNERRPSMLMRLERCGAHMSKFTPMITTTTRAPNRDIYLQDNLDGERARALIAKQLDFVGPENVDRGVELDARYTASEVIVTDGSEEPIFEKSSYTPSTRPGHRAPQVLLEGSKKSIVDLYGRGWTLMDFTNIPSDNSPQQVETEAAIKIFKDMAAKMNMPLLHVSVDSAEVHAKRVWEDYGLVLVRPDGYVAWRGCKEGARDESCELNEGRVSNIIKIVLGWKVDPVFVMGDRRKPDFEHIFCALEKV